MPDPAKGAPAVLELVELSRRDPQRVLEERVIEYLRLRFGESEKNVGFPWADSSFQCREPILPHEDRKFLDQSHIAIDRPERGALPTMFKWRISGVGSRG